MKTFDAFVFKNMIIIGLILFNFGSKVKAVSLYNSMFRTLVWQIVAHVRLMIESKTAK